MEVQNNKIRPEFSILLAVSFAHLLNDLIQGVIPSVYPLLKEEHQLSFSQIGMITFVYQIAASIFQPVVGSFTDKNPIPYSQIIGMTFSIAGMALFAYAPSYALILCAVFLVGIGSSIFHPESSRVAYMASGGKRSMAQSIFQIGGNAGTALAPIIVAYLVLPKGQSSIAWFCAIGLIGQVVSFYIGNWYSRRLKNRAKNALNAIKIPDLSEARVVSTVIILMLLIISKYFYIASITNYFQFYTMEKFGITEIQAQVYLFYFLIAVAAGTLLGGLFGDRFGRKYVIWFSVLGVAPFSLLLPYVDYTMTGVLVVIIGLILSSAFPAIIVYAQELLPKKLGMVSGLFYGFAFGMGGLGSALLGWQADHTSIEFIYHICSYLPLIGVVAYFLPNLQKTPYKEVL
ncbi:MULTISPECIES: MFS transporter [Sphingobacterium]|jgi:FSR family fosmidomycin resistance protein-like MFS transporter|uniref:MFS transporter n=1 Tax=Sphingobacterium TaxID=28453 RepID=UPI0004E5F6C3|nr:MULTISPECIES: MFS transporter [Sphingobacterium]CDS92451.1 fosmidomycin efflux system, member of the major facilitator superfamily [Sphingobacterium sp. PM2-P1-29]SJN17681.1 Fosmidomycin resistance protein [Sphingobacterium faecium PCAi_F2.5]HCU46108.1 MFS transporter [Sphingobacterium sp.]UPZ38514.1 MFS transporter [Sphingobacterium sp. PCS056]UXD69949.1 MFS transporter [Sphingobacterium faecium]